MVRENIEWTEEEKKELEKVKHQNHWIQVREERRLLHNRDAKEKGYHEYGPFRGKRAELTCKLCKKTCDLGQKGGSGMDFKRMKQNCPKNRANCDWKKEKLTELRNKNFMEWNENVARGKNRHLYYLVTKETHHLLACQREGCPLNTVPSTWPAVSRTLSNMPLRCDGVIEEGEKGNGKLENKVIPEHLQIF